MVKVQFFTIDVSWFIIILRPNYEGQNLKKKKHILLNKKIPQKKRPKYIIYKRQPLCLENIFK